VSYPVAGYRYPAASIQSRLVLSITTYGHFS
jgi:hypothetical protein